MVVFLVIDPAAGRRAWLRVFFQPPHEVVECSSLGESLTACAGRTFKAVFIAWPEGVRPGAADRPDWSCEHVVPIVADAAKGGEAGVWCGNVLPRVPIILMHSPDGYLTAREISRALSRILDAPEVPFPDMVGSSPVMRQLLEKAARVAANDLPVLIYGEPGTGKEALARWIRAQSARGQRPFAPFECSGLDPAAAISELFGHEKGAFTWAVQAKRGLLAAANEGTLYIREAGDLDPALQSKLLRFLEQRGGMERLGGQESHNVDVRLIAGSCRPLSERLGAEFSTELYYRLKQNYLETPPLRSRLSDVPHLARHFLARHSGGAARGLQWAPQALSALQQYQWPGNLNELEEVVAEAALKAERDGEIKLEHLPLRIRNTAEVAGRAATPPPPRGTRLSGRRTEVEGSWPEVGFRCDGYTMLETISTTPRARVFLAEGEGGPVLRVAKFSHARNENQLEAVREIRGLGDKFPEAKKFMIPIYHVNNCAAGPWFMIVLDRLDDARTGQKIERGRCQPHTFGEWITRRHWVPRPESHGHWSVISHIEAILRALDFFHQKKGQKKELIMNDAKPENFGFYERRLVAIDFGGFAPRGVPPHEFDLGYSPPEDRAGQPADDVYAVAVMLAEALYNIPPEELTPPRVPSLAEPYLREGKLFDLEVWHLILKGLSTNPGIRYQDAKSMLKDLKELGNNLNGDGSDPDGTAPPD